MKDSRYTARGFRVAQVLDALRRDGPMTHRTLCEVTGIPTSIMGHLMHRIRQDLTNLPKRAHIAYWERSDGYDDRYIAVFNIGNKPDAKKPPPKAKKEILHNHAERRKHKVNSVFELAVAPKNRYKQRKRKLNERSVGNASGGLPLQGYEDSAD